MRSDRHIKKKHRRRLWSVGLIMLFLLIGALSLYSYFQYQAGLKDSQEESGQPKVEYTFNGDRDKNGHTNILLLGSDARGEENSRADTIMIASYNPGKGTYKLASIMRDTYVSIPGHGENKINTALAFGGPDLLRQTIKENFDVDLQYYGIVDFQGFVRLIDTAFPHGVEVDVEKSMSKNIGVKLEPGIQKLDGEHLLGYVRFRQDAVGDFGRVERQQKVMKELGKQLASVQTLPKLPKLIGVVTPFVNTNMDTGDILYMARGFISEEGRSVQTLRIPVENSFQNQRISGVGAVLAIDVETNRQALNEFLVK
ncbi:cell envelope-related function transcriptional attenuator common domain-containing protein [Mesobacillus persicus]|uniref:Regulatory protein MsrR n=1 Tax=Mesobacillus persicus TaxID=930146 RepID=A0A1H8E0R4_9BACI|nr:LCP family protein [Mesobacillus persicus]SEN13072.1 cell envelope-related function transcriptional attenuator common domain-containing protein [Mesobacillus persicus]